MSAPLGKNYPVGLRHVRVYELNSNGVPNASGTAVYEGYQITGAKAYELSIPDARRIAHIGDDRVLAQDILPRQEVSTGTLRAGRNDYDVYAVLTDTKQATIGESSIIGYGTDKQGDEPALAMLCYQQAKEAGTGTRTYRAYMLPSTKAIINPASMNEKETEYTFSLLPSAANHHIWGIQFTTAKEGFTEAEIVESSTFDFPHVAAWKSDGTAVSYLFHADRPAASSSKIHAVATITSGGVVADVTSTVTLAAGSITFGVAPAADTVICAFYEYE